MLTNHNIKVFMRRKLKIKVERERKREKITRKNFIGTYSIFW